MSKVLLTFILAQAPSINEDSLFQQGFHAYKNGDFSGAEHNLTQHSRLYPESKYAPEVLYLLGDIYFKQKKYPQAIEYWQKLVQKYPDCSYVAQSVIGIGDAYCGLKRYATAIRTYRRARKLVSSDELIRKIDLKIYECEYNLGKYPDLIDALTQFIDDNPDTTKTGGIIAETMLRIAKIYTSKKEYYSARTVLERLLETYPQTPIINEVLQELASVNKLLGDMEAYKKVLQMIVSKKDTLDFYAHTLIELANLYLDEQKYDSSLYYWLKLRELDDFKDQALYEIARVYYRMGFIDEALLVLETFVKSFPESKFSTDANNIYIEILEGRGDYEKVKDVLIDLLKKRPRQPELLFKLGDTYFELRDYKMALNCYIEASESFGDRRDEAAKSLIRAGDAALSSGDTTNARRYYSNARRIAVSEQIKNLSTIKLNQLR